MNNKSVPSGRPSPEHPAGAGRLLVVDDDFNNRDMLSRRLARRGYSVEVAESGPLALEKILRENYDLILLDQMMPGMSGLDLLRLLRATYSQSELPVIMVTAVDQSESVVEALTEGANDYIVKPVDLSIAAARIQAHLARSRSQEEAKNLDALTGLSNRSQLVRDLTTALARQRTAKEGALAVLMLDLDAFKIVNDGFGHAIGDRILVEIANKLRGFRDSPVLAGRARLGRLGGDEFVVIMERCESPDYAGALAESLVKSLGQNIALNGFEISVSASIGIATSEDGEQAAETLLCDADLAMYQAKHLGKNRAELFRPSMGEHARRRVANAIDLRQALGRNEFAAFYQPKVDLACGAIVGFEALIRWIHPERGLVMPSEFIPLAEETGLIIPIGEWMLWESCRQLKLWQTRFPGTPMLNMNVNLSVRQLSDPNLVACVETILKETGIPPETLKLELTESSLMSDVNSAQSVLGRLQNLKVGLKLDDFGTGYSSLSYLRSLHFDGLKIDRSFVSRIASDPETREIIRSIVDLAHNLRMSVVAEGIETEAQLHELSGMGCDTGQGYLFGRPLDRESAERFLEQRLQKSV